MIWWVTQHCVHQEEKCRPLPVKTSRKPPGKNDLASPESLLLESNPYREDCTQVKVELQQCAGMAKAKRSQVREPPVSTKLQNASVKPGCMCAGSRQASGRHNSGGEEDAFGGSPLNLIWYY